jgi:hypothetical protein
MKTKRIKRAVDGVMYVLGCSHLDPDKPAVACTIVYVVHAPGTEPIPGQQVFDVEPADWPYPGQTLPVTFDRARPARIAIHWEQLELAAGV